VEIPEEAIQDLPAMLACSIENTIDSVFVDSENPGCSSYTIAFGQGAHDPPHGLLIGMEAEEDGVAPLREAGPTCATTQELSAVLSIGFIADDVSMSPFSVIPALLIEAEDFGKFHRLPPLQMIG